MSDSNSSNQWQPNGDDCASCGKTMLEDHEYEQCYSCTPNSRIARDSTQEMEASPRAREIQSEIEAVVENGGPVEIDTTNEQ